MSDLLSLTLPKPNSRTRARRRRRRRPPNWKRLLATLLWDGWIMMLFLTAPLSIWTLTMASSFALDISLIVRRWFREDGGWRMPGEDSSRFWLSVALWLIAMFGHFVIGP